MSGTPSSRRSTPLRHLPSAVPASTPQRITEVTQEHAGPRASGLGELDRVLGGGFVPGSVTLLGGEPGIGKSTLLMQLLAWWAGVALYVTAEESSQQVAARAERLDAMRPDLWLLAETALPAISAAIETTGPELIVIDSIQSVYDPELSSPPGSVGQVRACAHRFVEIAKAREVAVVMVGHVTKDGGLAGPRVLEHVVDTVLQFEGDRTHALRMLRAAKHRFGATSELGVMEMTGSGLVGVPDASRLFLTDRRAGVPGSAVVPTMEGRRPITVEVQALTSPAPPGVPARRSAQGLDGGRLSMLCAVLARRAQVDLATADVWASTAGGTRIVEPGADLALCLALASALAGEPLDATTVAIGEVGLGGEVRQVPHLARRLEDAARLGFEQAIVPATCPATADLELLPVGTIADAVALAGLARCRPRQQG